VEVNREAQSANLMAMNSILDLSVNVSAHRSMNTCKGVVRSYDLAQTSETELLSELSSQGVTHVQHIFVTRDGQKKRTNTLIMTFAQSTPPNYISAGYLKVPVDIYYPSPLRCFNCQQFGHHRATCKHTAVCALCGLAHHGDSPCTSPKSCVNCRGDHTSYDKTCPRWQKETEIVKTKINNNISFPEARKMIEARSTSTSTITYSAMVKSTKSIATQTDIVNCTCHCRVEVVQAQSRTSSTSIQTDSIQPCTTTNLTKNTDSITKTTDSITSSTIWTANTTCTMPITSTTEVVNIEKNKKSPKCNKKSPETSFEGYHSRW